MPSDTPTTPPMTPDEAERHETTLRMLARSIEVSCAPWLDRAAKLRCIGAFITAQQAEIERLREERPIPESELEEGVYYLCRWLRDATPFVARWHKDHRNFVTCPGGYTYNLGNSAAYRKLTPPAAQEE